MPLDSLLTDSLRELHSLTILQIGANDGITHDLVHPLINDDRLLKAVLVEPLPGPFSKLRSRHHGNPKVVLENLAIATSPGTVTMYTIDDDNGITNFDSKISSLDKAHLEKFIQYDPMVKSVIREEIVQSDTLANVITRNHLTEVDLLYIDTEGFDYEILRMMPWEICVARLVFYEQGHLGHDGRIASYRLLRSKGYKLFQCDRDVLGIRDS